jgi:dTDP-4-dehydrorhamnose 3,5-epimerase
MIEFVRTEIPDVLLIKPKLFSDDRGLFLESYQARKFAEIGIREQFVRDNHSGSRKSTLRGMHYQIRQPPGGAMHLWASGGLFPGRRSCLPRIQTACPCITPISSTENTC